MDEHVHTAYAIELTPECLEVLCLELRHLGLLQDFLRPSLCLRDHGGADVAAAHQCSPFSEGDGEVASAAPGVADRLTGDLHIVHPIEDLLDGLRMPNSDVHLHWVHIFGIAINTFPAAEALAIEVIRHDLLVVLFFLSAIQDIVSAIQGIGFFLQRARLLAAIEDRGESGNQDQRRTRQRDPGIGGRSFCRCLISIGRGGGRCSPRSSSAQGGPEPRHFWHCRRNGWHQPATLGGVARRRARPCRPRAGQRRHHETQSNELKAPQTPASPSPPQVAVAASYGPIPGPEHQTA
mmetsp:Transcript_70499/g.151026  ORF Transcript_70499/g.151026 Transcript_70499/m.151026 type:complete len:293 (+) Transcript_70499:330-1208(+)